MLLEIIRNPQRLSLQLQRCIELVPAKGERTLDFPAILFPFSFRHVQIVCARRNDARSTSST